jgi:crotonobetainyl-CoA:carnitine CoA-transferase CaiB-like acyl-CoA transferase
MHKPVEAAAAAGMQAQASHLPLSRFKVIDLTLARAGPSCVRTLADWGSDES